MNTEFQTADQQSTGGLCAPQSVILCPAKTGPMFVFAADEVIGHSLLTSGQFGEHKIDEVVEYLRRVYGFSAETFVDIGANIGTHLLHALLSGGFSSGIGIEADPDNFRLLQANVAVRQLWGRAKLITCALSSQPGIVEMELCPRNYGDHRIRIRSPDAKPDFGESARRTRWVESDTADHILGDLVRDWASTLVWIDTQGHEGQILSGGAQSLVQQAPAVVMEFWPYGLDRAGGSARVFKFLEECVAVFDINCSDWQRQGEVQPQDLEELYDRMLAETTADHYPHTDLLCIRGAIRSNMGAPAGA